MVLADRQVVSLGVKSSRVRPGSIAYWCLRFWDREDLFEFKLALLAGILLCGGIF